MTSLPTLDEQLYVRLTLTLLHFVWQGAAIALGAILVTMALRRAAPAARYCVLMVSLLLMAACPPVTFLLVPADAGIAADTTDSEAAWPGLHLPDEQLLPAHGAKAVHRAHDADAVPAGWSVGAALKHLLDLRQWQAWSHYIVAAYLAGVVVVFSRLMLALYGGTRLRRVAEPVQNEQLLASLRRQANMMGLRFTPAIAWCDQVAVPTVIGVLRPSMLLPLAVASGLSAQQVEVLLAHELAHIRRYDHLVNLLQRMIEAFLFFHPAVWFVSGRIRVERELCCDDRVVGTGFTPLMYADSLVGLAQMCQQRRGLHMVAAAAALGAAGNATQLRQRVYRLVGEPDYTPMRLTRVWAMALVVAVALPVCMKMQAVAQPSSGTPTAEQPLGPGGQAKLTWERFPHEFADYYCTQGIPVSSFETKPDFCRSDNALLLDLKQSPFATTMVIDASGGTGSPYDTLYVDFNRNGKYTDDPIYKAGPFKGEYGPDREPVRAYFPDVAVPRPSIAGAKPRVQIFLQVDNATMIPAQWAVGTMTIGGKTMPAALVDTNWDGNVSAAGGRKPGLAPDLIPNGDCLILGIDGEKELRPPTPETRLSLFIPGEGGSSRGFLAKHLVLDSGTYEIKAEQLTNGASLKLSPAQVPTGTVKLTETPTRSHVLLMGQSTCVMRSGHPTELVVPDDTYLFMNRPYSTNEFAIKRGEQTVVDPQEDPRRTPRPALSQPAVSPEAVTPASSQPADAWTRYVQQFIATNKLDAAQQSQAWSILKNLQGRAQEYRASHRAEYDAAGKIKDKKEQDQAMRAFVAPLGEMFEELKTRLAAIPTEAQRDAMAGGKQAAVASRPATR